MAKAPSAGGVQSIERSFEILEIMGSVSGPIGVSELAERTGLPMPTIHRLIRTLLNLGYVRQLPSRRYALGPRLIRLGESATQQFGTSSRTHLAELVEEIGETANMAVLDATMAVYVAQVPSAHSMRMFTEVGRRVHLHCTGVGKALLMQMPDATVRNVLARAGMPRSTDHTITDADAMIDELHRSRERGYAIDEAEQEIGVRCYAVPVPNAPSVTAVSISGPAGRVTLEAAERFVPILQRVAKELSSDFQREPH
ncbi:IclR family transcriptional regulator [Mycobacterium sp. 236(2023)]|uniref:IclR family transcriptional regulator n=1 Tax=Mycobacterium sp. 236(2023) TaxID=3038163 RepID=UPI0024152727|nr:IclR family transcriptional regulator [Mycobacterium sp. 236(2023)]MDG4669380.1 IclR family transcriptional regulator [Mycobacterium sp. 236(2023)]